LIPVLTDWGRLRAFFLGKFMENNKELITIDSLSNNAIAGFTCKPGSLELLLNKIESEALAVVAEQARQKAIDDAKSADLEHRQAVNKAVFIALVENGVDEADAIKIIKLAVSGVLGALKVIY